MQSFGLAFRVVAIIVFLSYHIFQKNSFSMSFSSQHEIRTNTRIAYSRGLMHIFESGNHF
jgi:hypothetical protein